MAKKKKISEENKDFFKLGLLEGEERTLDLQRAVILMKKTNNELLGIINQMDKNKPRIGVLVTFKTMRNIIKGLQKATKNYPLAKKLSKMMVLAQVEADSHALQCVKKAANQVKL